MKITCNGDNITVEIGGMTFSFPPDWQEDIVKAGVQREKADAWEARCAELEQELRDAQETSNGLAEIIVARDSELRTFNKTVQKLEQELREVQGKLDESVKCEARMGLENSKLRSQIEELQDRIHEMDWTIAKYDDENRELKKRNDRLWIQNRNMGERQESASVPFSLNDWARRIHENAVAHGWWETGDRPLPEILMLCVTELAEAMEEYRNGKPLIYDGEDGKPEGIAVEMIDCIIRILDWMGHNNVDVDNEVDTKVTFNEGRPYRHGGKKA